MERCSFFKTYGAAEDKSLAIAGFIRMYCKGRRQDECVRKSVSAILGGPQKVPANMLPNGLAMSGTSADDWPEEAKAARRNASSEAKG
jgi:hypothetical protein